MTAQTLQKEQTEAVRAHFGADFVPFYISAIASAVAYDILHGPAYALIPNGDITKFTADNYYSFFDDAQDALESPDDVIIEVFREKNTGPCLVDELRRFIDSLPTKLYYCLDSGDVSEFEPEGEYVESDDLQAGEAEWCEPEPYTTISRREIVAILFGRTIAKEFY